MSQFIGYLIGLISEKGKPSSGEKGMEQLRGVCAGRTGKRGEADLVM